VTPLSVVPDGVASAHSNPLWNGPVLLKLFGKLALDDKRLVGRHRARFSQDERTKIGGAAADQADARRLISAFSFLLVF